MIIEFMGVPGAGKTTLCHALADALEHSSGRVATTSGRGAAAPSRLSRNRRLRSYAAASWRWRSAIWLAMGPLARSRRPWRDKLTAVRLLVVALGRYEIAERSMDVDWVLIDEGFLQRCFTVFVDGASVPSAERIRALVAAGPHGDVVVHVTTSAETALQRLADRDRGLPARLAALSHGDLLATFRSGEPFGAIARALSGDAERPTTVITVDAEDTDDACQVIRNAIEAGHTRLVTA